MSWTDAPRNRHLEVRAVAYLLEAGDLALVGLGDTHVHEEFAWNVSADQVRDFLATRPAGRRYKIVENN